ncbi:T9SS type A sorting domain-containing protein [Flammeovirga sp. OC4]|uniref:VPS10 domain-containing protein n=1 Tax=Flammeovirga sp. OC4 TaxID=1382345 RepID=UPI0012E0BF4A|nr:T9SS type A sorting domain-containing protein [Flammeovirga sp. OC4]
MKLLLYSITWLGIYCFCSANAMAFLSENDTLPPKAKTTSSSTFFKELQTTKLTSNNEYVWTQFGPGMSGYCEEFWCHPTDDDVLFMSPDMYNSYGSWDGGNSWHTIKDVDGSGKDMRRIQSIVFSHQDPDFGLAIDVRGHLYKSMDKGHTWQFQSSFNGGGRHSEMTVDPTDDNNWYIGAGDFWNIKANHRSQNNTLGHTYNYSAYGHIWKSTDKGNTWKKIKSGLPSNLDVGKIIVSPIDNNILLMVANSGVYKSKDQGKTWGKSAEGLPNNNPRDMVHYYDQSTHELIFYVLEQTYYHSGANHSISSTGGVFKSTDQGESWESITGNLALDMTQITNYITKDKYWRAVSYWLEMSKSDFKAKYTTFPHQVLPVFNRIAVNPLNKNEIYLGHNVKHDFSFGPGDVWKTSDGGNTWNATARTGTYWLQEKDQAYWSGRNQPEGMNTKFAHLQYQMENMEETFGNRFLAINQKGEAFICLDQQVLKTVDGGISWQQIDDVETEEGSGHWVGTGDSNLPGRFMLLETGKEGRYFFCSGEHGLWESADLGNYPNKEAVAVKQIEGQVHKKGAHSIATVAVHPNNPDIIYILMFRQSHRGYLRKSTDGGKTWTNVAKAIQHEGNDSSDMLFQYSLTIDPDNPQNLYFCVIENAVAEVSANKIPKDFHDFGIYKSTDEGKTWSIMNNGLPTTPSVRRIVMDPNNSKTLYAALNQNRSGEKGGLYKTTDQGQNWQEMTIPSTVQSVNNFFIDRNNRSMYISCGTEDGTMTEGGVWKSDDEGLSWTKIFDLPYIWQTEVSPVNSSIITVVAALPHENKGATIMNPGAYISEDGGSTWIKVNNNLGQPDVITDFKPDPYTEGAYWCALKGSGWAKVGTRVNLGLGGNTDDKDDEVPTDLGRSTQEETIRVFPNPMASQCTIDISKIGVPSELNVDVVNMEGRSVLSLHEMNSSIVKMDTKTLQSGVYILMVNADRKQYIKRILID